MTDEKNDDENLQMHILQHGDHIRGPRDQRDPQSHQATLPRGPPRDLQSKAQRAIQQPGIFPEPALAYQTGVELNGLKMRKVTGLKKFRRIVGMRYSWLGRETLNVPEDYYDAICIVAVSINGKQRVIAYWA